MSALNQEQVKPGIDPAIPSEQRKNAIKPQSIQPCSFRSAGHLSNENSRTLTSIHETFARNLAGTLRAYIRTDVKIKMLSLDQFSVKDHSETISAFGYIAKFPLSSATTHVVVECESDLVFPMIDLLLGGRDISQSEIRDLSEIEDEIMLDLALVIARQAEGAWNIPGISVATGSPIDSETLNAIFPASEKLVVARFEIEVAEIIGTFQVVFPASVADVLIKQSKQSQPRKKGALRFPTSSLRERMLDCDVVVAADLPSMKVCVRDLIALQPGYVLKLRAPVRTPGVLTVEGREIFEAVPVRNGAQKAAQVGRRVPHNSWGKE
jgi:flagellar motor switch protein FliM